MKKILIAILFLFLIGGIYMAYTRINWQNEPSTATPTSAENLNIMDKGIADAHSLLAEKASQSDVASLITSKADTAYVDTKVAAVASGSPKGTYATLIALQTAFPTGNTNIYLVSADGNWYYWNDSAWTPGGVYQSTGIQDRSISPDKLSFTALPALKSKNLFNKDTVTQGYYIDYTTGNLVASGTRLASDFIPVKPSTSYTKSDISQLAFYDLNKQYISGVSTGRNFISPANAAFIRIGILNTDLDIYQIEEGTYVRSSGYESHIPKITGDMIKEKSISKDKLNFNALVGIPSKNLFNKDTIIPGYFVDYTIGILVVSANYSASDYIPVEPNLTYTKSDNMQIAFYDKNKGFVSGVITGTGAITFTVPVGVAYVRFGVLNTLLDTYQLEKGSVASGYVKYVPTLNPDSLPDILKQPYQNQIVVAKSGGQYTTISEAVAGANDSAENPITIYIMPGIYEESVDIRGRYISLIGLNRETTVIKNYLADYYQPPINMSGSFNHIANLTIISDKNESTPTQLGSYAIHCDSIGLGAGQSTIRNCTIECVQNAAIGLGTTDKQNIIIDNCDLLSHEKYSLYAHNYQLSGATEQKMIVQNCKIRTKASYAAIMIQDANHREGGSHDDAQDTVFTFYNNMAWSDMAGKTGMLGGDTALDENSWRGYIKLSADSFGNKITEVESRFQALTTEQQQAAEVIDARKGKVSLKAKMDDLDSQLASITNQFQNIADGEIQAVLNDELVHTDIANKLLAKEIEYAPRLTTAESDIDILQIDIEELQTKTDLATVDTQIGTFVQSKIADDCFVELTIEGATTVTPANPLLDISPDNVATITSAKDFDVVACGKNLLKNAATTTTINGITFTVNEDKSITVNGTVTTGTNARLLLSKVYLPVGKYKISGTPSGGYGDSYVCAIKNSSEGVYTLIARNGSDLEFEITNVKDYYNFYIRIASTFTFNNVVFQPMIRVSSANTPPYKPYQEDKITIPFELRSLPNGVKDTIEYIGNGKGKLVQRVEEVVFDGSEDEEWLASSTNVAGFSRNIITNLGGVIKNVDTAVQSSLICTHYKTVTSNTPGTFGRNKGISSDNLGRIIIYDEVYNTSDISLFRAWLSINPVTVQYELETPIETIIDLPPLTSYKGITNVFTTASVQPVLTVSFKSRLKNTTEVLLAKIEKLTNAIINLGGTV